MKKGIGIFGGTFDPFHNGHLQTISEIAQLSYINRLDIVPTWKPKYKKASSFNFRFCSVVRGISGQGLGLKKVIPRTTMRLFKQQYICELIRQYIKEDEKELYLFVGNDWDITTWKEYDYILKNCTIKTYLRHEPDERITAEIDHAKLDISSTMIRWRVKNKLSINGLVPLGVNLLIKEEKAYV